MSEVVGPFTPTTPTVLIDCQNNTFVPNQSLTALNSDGWPHTFFCTNVGANPTYFTIASSSYVTTISPNGGNFLMPGQSMIFTLNEQFAQIDGEALLGFSFGIGATTVSVTGGLNQ